MLQKQFQQVHLCWEESYFNSIWRQVRAEILKFYHLDFFSFISRPSGKNMACITAERQRLIYRRKFVPLKSTLFIKRPNQQLSKPCSDLFRFPSTRENVCVQVPACVYKYIQFPVYTIVNKGGVIIVGVNGSVKMLNSNKIG